MSKKKKDCPKCKEGAMVIINMAEEYQCDKCGHIAKSVDMIQIRLGQ